MDNYKGNTILSRIREYASNKVVQYSSFAVMGVSMLFGGCKRTDDNLIYKTKDAKIYYSEGWRKGTFICEFNNPKEGKRVDVLTVEDEDRNLDDILANIDKGGTTLKWTSVDPKGGWIFNRRKYSNRKDAVDRVVMEEHEQNAIIYLLKNQTNINNYVTHR